jgi:hypothetical protein
MSQPQLPPRGIFVPTRMIFYPDLPSAVLVTWIKLRSLAWDGWVTPALSISEIASLIGIHPDRLNKHLSNLQDISALACRSDGNGRILVSFPEDPNVGAENRAEDRNLSDTTLLISEAQASLDPPSYFPDRILGYLSFQDEQEPYPY